jgi:hypothetical protein
MVSLSHWQFIYSISLGYPVQPNYQEVQNYKEFFVALQYVIPCHRYRKYYATYLATYPIERALDNHATLIRWVLNMHPKMRMVPLNQIQMSGIIWYYLQMICQYYPQKPTFQEVLFYKNFFITLQNVIPNGPLRTQYNRQVTQMPIDPYLSSRQKIMRWFDAIHHKIIDSNPPDVIEHFTDYKNVMLITSLILIAGVIIYSNLSRQ